MTANRVNLTLTSRPDPDLNRALSQLRKTQAETERYVKIMTVEQALLAQKLVRESAHRGR